MADLKNLSFFSGVNYLKRDDSLSGSGNANFTGVAGQAGELVIEHNLGYIPFVSVGAELSEPGVLWTTNTTPLFLLGGVDTVRFSYWVTTTALTIRMINSEDVPVTGSRMFCWVIYLDYGDV